jgi:Cu/Ag efflux protein CusF
MRRIHAWLLVVLCLAVTVCFVTTGLADDTKKDRASDKALTVKGKITKVTADDNQFTMKSEEGKELTFHLDPQSKIRVGTKDARVTDLKEGKEVAVTYEARAGKNVVTSLICREQ